MADYVFTGTGDNLFMTKLPFRKGIPVQPKF